MESLLGSEDTPPRKRRCRNNIVKEQNRLSYQQHEEILEDSYSMSECHTDVSARHFNVPSAESATVSSASMEANAAVAPATTVPTILNLTDTDHIAAAAIQNTDDEPVCYNVETPVLSNPTEETTTHLGELPVIENVQNSGTSRRSVSIIEEQSTSTTTTTPAEVVDLLDDDSTAANRRMSILEDDDDLEIIDSISSTNQRVTTAFAASTPILVPPILVQSEFDLPVNTAPPRGSVFWSLFKNFMGNPNPYTDLHSTSNNSGIYNNNSIYGQTPSPPVYILHPDDPEVIIEALMSKLTCPICYRGFSRRRHMVQYSKKLTAKRAHTDELEECNNNTIGTNEVSSITLSDVNKERDDDSTVSLKTIIEEDPIMETEHETSEIRVGRCGHVYCDTCIRKYIAKRKKCPVCSQQLSSRQLYPLFL